MHRIFVVHWKEAFELILNFSSARWHSWCSNICDLLCFLVSFIDINFGFSYSVSIGPSYLVTSYVLSVPCLSPLTTTTTKKKNPSQATLSHTSSHAQLFVISFTFSSDSSDSDYIWKKFKCLMLTPIDFCYFAPICPFFLTIPFIHLHHMSILFFFFFITCPGKETEGDMQAKYSIHELAPVILVIQDKE